MKITKKLLKKLLEEHKRLELAQKTLDEEVGALQEEVRVALETVKPICICAISQFDEDPNCHIHIYRRLSAVQVSFDDKTITLDVRMRNKTTRHEFDEELMGSEELGPYFEKLKAILDPMLKEAGIPLVLHSLTVPSEYYCK